MFFKSILLGEELWFWIARWTLCIWTWLVCISLRWWTCSGLWDAAGVRAIAHAACSWEASPPSSGDVVPEGVLYLGGFPDAHHDQLAVIESHQNVRLLFGHRHAPDGQPHSHRRHAQSQAAMSNQERGGVRIKFILTILHKNNEHFQVLVDFHSISFQYQHFSKYRCLCQTGLRVSKYEGVELSFNKVQQAGSGSKSLNDYF